MIPTLAALSYAAAPTVLHPGQTVLDVADGDPVVAEAIRHASGLAPAEDPPAGTVLWLPDPDPIEARVVALAGAGTVTPSGGAPAALRFADRVPFGALVCVDDDSFATIRLAIADHPWRHDDLTLLSGTCVRVDGAAERAGTRSSLISIERGEVGVVDGEDDTGRVLVRTPGVLTSAAGGGFRVALEGADTTRTESLTADTSVIAGDVELVLGPGEGARADASGIVGPIRLLPAPVLYTPAADVQLRRPDFSWSDQQDAIVFRVLFATDPHFSSVVRVASIAGASWSPDLLFLTTEAGVLWWRIDPVDRTGMVGVPSEPRLIHFPTGVSP